MSNMIIRFSHEPPSARLNDVPFDHINTYDIVCKIEYQDVVTRAVHHVMDFKPSRMNDVHTAIVCFDTLKLGDETAVVYEIPNNVVEGIKRLGVRYKQVYNRAIENIDIPKRNRIVRRDERYDSVLLWYNQSIEVGPTGIGIGVRGTKVQNAMAREKDKFRANVVDPAWYTPEGRWSSSQYAYLAHEMYES